MDRYAEGVDTGYFVSTFSALYYLAKTGIENGMLLFTSDSEHLRSACGTHTLSGRLTILHGYSPGIFHLSLGTTFHTICLHLGTSFVDMKDILSPQ